MVRRKQIDVFTYQFVPAQVTVLVTNILWAEMNGKWTIPVLMSHWLRCGLMRRRRRFVHFRSINRNLRTVLIVFFSFKRVGNRLKIVARRSRFSKMYLFMPIRCHGNQSSQGIGFVLAILKEDVIRNICAKFDHFLISSFREVVKVNCWRRTRDDAWQTMTDDGWRRTTDTALSQQLTLAQCHSDSLH